MEPQPGGCGNARGLTVYSRISLTFNGAAAGWLRKQGSFNDVAKPRFLAWSRSRVAAETSGDLRRMFAVICLQWSRSRVAAETSRKRSIGSRSMTFNGAAAGWLRKRGDAQIRQMIAESLQWSRSRVAAET